MPLWEATIDIAFFKSNQGEGGGDLVHLLQFDTQEIDLRKFLHQGAQVIGIQMRPDGLTLQVEKRGFVQPVVLPFVMRKNEDSTEGYEIRIREEPLSSRDRVAAPMVTDKLEPLRASDVGIPSMTTPRARGGPRGPLIEADRKRLRESQAQQDGPPGAIALPGETWDPYQTLVDPRTGEILYEAEVRPKTVTGSVVLQSGTISGTIEAFLEANVEGYAERRSHACEEDRDSVRAAETRDHPLQSNEGEVESGGGLRDDNEVAPDDLREERSDREAEEE